MCTKKKICKWRNIHKHTSILYKKVGNKIKKRKKLEENKKTWFDFFFTLKRYKRVNMWFVNMNGKKEDIYTQRFEKEEFEKLKEIQKS